MLLCPRFGKSKYFHLIWLTYFQFRLLQTYKYYKPPRAHTGLNMKYKNATSALQFGQINRIQQEQPLHI